MLIIFFRVLILYLSVFLIIRMMGQRQVGQMQPSELIVTIMTADIATGPLESIDTPLFNGLVPLFVMYFIDALIIFIILKSHMGRRILTGKPAFIVRDGIIQDEEMKRLRISISDLYEQLRSKGFPRLHEVNYVIMETNGEMSIIPKKDMGLPINVIADGKRLRQNLEEWNISESWLDDELKKNEITSDKEIFLAYVDEETLYIHKKGMKP